MNQLEYIFYYFNTRKHHNIPTIVRRLLAIMYVKDDIRVIYIICYSLSYKLT